MGTGRRGRPDVQRAGRYLIDRRCRRTPAMMGLPSAPGDYRRLSREEAAYLCGMTRWAYTRLEQGRNVRFPPEDAERIADGLRFDAEERRVLLAYVGVVAPEPEPGPRLTDRLAFQPTHLGDTVRLLAAPAAVVDHRLTLRAANEPFEKLLDGEPETGSDAPNLGRLLLGAGRWNVQGGDGEQILRAVAADLRFARTVTPRDGRLDELIGELSVLGDFREALADPTARRGLDGLRLAIIRDGTPRRWICTMRVLRPGLRPADTSRAQGSGGRPDRSAVPVRSGRSGKGLPDGGDRADDLSILVLHG
ncbi:hypothetical protein CXF35_01370 [Corynebacterium bovis]|uniref:HTH cro/C1-type domain-containing protein n=5 Tax=Corynebacterium bovis TaxID=36808 RepID=A0A426Q5H7_9CORY|nr:helix-turn-helix domain-containing protein [Corynebacterium bovis]RRO91498.1 hypothetical protein CXF40_06270 [Corynebacterium bovis]RRQ00774.1 hypothetical protein CXF41_06180 [Corynebacterium bovis]RRQ04160.1 hypothetical protein CXF39_02615 [Corynebacterium bovis]RRQ04521.1 hypothetical protein CXF42_04330 [Corynebacterium bovis]RRQ07623.1 hypothetical protein CXF43_03550 [Corynebacterium bovis]